MKKILVIDDDPDEAALLGLSFPEPGTVLVPVKTVPEAVAAVKREDFDLILLDLKLVSENGLCFVYRMKQLGKTTPICILTGAPVSERLEAVVKHGYPGLLGIVIKQAPSAAFRRQLDGLSHAT